jgi:hypothetical protein
MKNFDPPRVEGRPLGEQHIEKYTPIVTEKDLGQPKTLKLREKLKGVLHQF